MSLIFVLSGLPFIHLPCGVRIGILKAQYTSQSA
jgi:hypothetical protein